MRKQTLVGSGIIAVALVAVSPLPANAGLVAGDILISNHTGDNVQLLDPSTSSVSTLVSLGGGNTPIGLAFDTTLNNLYINVGDGIDKYNIPSNTLTPFFSGNGEREGLTFDPVTGHLFSVSFGSNLVEEVDLAGNLVRTITIPGTSSLLGIAVRGGTLVITDFGGGGVYVGTTTGSTFTQIGTVDPGNTYGPDIDASGNIYVNDFAGHVDKFTPDGMGGYTESTFITGLSGPDNGLSIGDDGSFTISEFLANEVAIYNSDGTLRNNFPGVESPDELVVFAPERQSGGGGTPSVPEPGTIILFGPALAWFWMSRRRQDQ